MKGRNNQSLTQSKPSSTKRQFPPFLMGGTGVWILFFLLTWLWASWWMGDVFRIAYERSYFAANDLLMHWLWQQSFGSLWIMGRALLTLYHWPVVGGFLVAVLLTVGSWLIGYCLRLPRRWRLTQYLPAIAWMTWTAWIGLDLFFMHEPGRILGIPFLCLIVCTIDAFIIWTFKQRKKTPSPLPLNEENGSSPEKPSSLLHSFLLKGELGRALLILLLCFALPILILNHRHPYLRPLTRMQVQLLHNDYDGMSATMHDCPELSYRHLAAYYAIALTRTGHLTDQLFDIRLEYDSVHVHDYGNLPSDGLTYYNIDCDYHAGLIRPAMHRAMEELTMDGPSLFTLKYLAKMALIEGEWALARKYFHVIRQAPFEGDFLAKYEPMLEHPELVQADPEIASVLMTEPVYDAFESQFEKPVFLGYYAVIGVGKTMEALNLSIMVNLYSKRMPDFLARCEMLVGTTPPRSIAEGLITQCSKNPAILQAFPQLKMDAQRYQTFLRNVAPYMQDRGKGGDELFETYRGYYPYYYFFGNLRATRKREDIKDHSKAGVN